VPKLVFSLAASLFYLLAQQFHHQLAYLILHFLLMLLSGVLNKYGHVGKILTLFQLHHVFNFILKQTYVTKTSNNEF